MNIKVKCGGCGEDMGKAYTTLEARNKRLRETLEEIGLEQDPIFPKMQHCIICGWKDVAVMGHASNCKLDKALKGK